MRISRLVQVGLDHSSAQHNGSMAAKMFPYVYSQSSQGSDIEGGVPQVGAQTRVPFALH